MVDQVGARLLVVSGDVRAVQYLRETLPEPLTRRLEIALVKGSRSADGSQQTRAQLGAAEAAAFAVREREELLRRFGEERAPGGLAVEGEDATLAALREGRVATLIVVRPVVDDPRLAWFGHAPTEVEPMSRPTPPWEDPRRGPLLDVAVSSALLSGAEVRVVPAGESGPAEGLGGICRFR